MWACQIGPFARLRQDARLSRDVRVGNFVEVKNATIGEGSKASHLTYIGDSRIGRDVNVARESSPATTMARTSTRR